MLLNNKSVQKTPDQNNKRPLKMSDITQIDNMISSVENDSKDKNVTAPTSLITVNRDNQSNPSNPSNKDNQNNQVSSSNNNPINQNYVINIQHSDTESIIVETNYTHKKFMFYDKNKNFLGGFSIYDFIKYITSNVSFNFLSSADADTARPIIEKYILNIKLIENLGDNKYQINMLNYFESPFMGNIEILVKLYAFIYDFEENEMKLELDKMSNHNLNNLNNLNNVNSVNIENVHKEVEQVVNIFNNMLYILLNHMLRIISALTNKFSHNDDQKIKDSLLKYSVGIVYRLSKFIKNDVDKKITELDNLKSDILRINLIRSNLLTKVDLVQKSIDKQDAQINLLLRHLLISKSLESNKKNNSISQLSQSSISQSSTQPSSLSSSQSNISQSNISQSNISQSSSQSNTSSQSEKSVNSYELNDLLSAVDKMTKNKKSNDSSSKSLSDILSLGIDTDLKNSGDSDNINIKNDLSNLIIKPNKINSLNSLNSTNLSDTTYIIE
jgi:hypothetical protein